MHPEMEGVRHKLVQMLVIKLRDACNPVSAESGKAIDKLNFFMEALEETEDRARTNVGKVLRKLNLEQAYKLLHLALKLIKEKRDEALQESGGGLRTLGGCFIKLGQNWDLLEDPDAAVLQTLAGATTLLTMTEKENSQLVDSLLVGESDASWDALSSHYDLKLGVLKHLCTANDLSCACDLKPVRAVQYKT